MRAYVVGNIAIDETIAVDEMPARGASILGRQQSRDLGGKGANQAAVLSRTGLDTTLIAAVGDDFRADSITRRVEREALDARLLRIEGGASDFSMVLVTPDGDNSIVTTTDSAQNLPLDAALAIMSGAKAGDVLVLQGNLSDATTRSLLVEGKRLGTINAFNPSPVRPFFAAFWPLIDIAFLNEGEAELLTGRQGEEAMRTLVEAGVSTAVLTLGAEGALVVSGAETVKVPAKACPVVDTTGAGDTFMATALASAALRGVTVDRLAVEHAAEAAALTVSRRGTFSAFPTRIELTAILAQR
ncbi:PfkB family carbohydrate kinase [Rhizobium sp. EC-SD404]|uniref:PfkB family carbohydrate kinase n=1 Tax=Rhizobium sp. EC-SD404 TaxID=2038389 RepID=UPI0012592A2A|nr:PfkB family carbohydrate kinase [Rhizobium sp. EC-SD404]VVS97653.1 Ribokinase [Rhizobium sp. EC-SD404]